jgi:hypothetical protein
VLNTSIVTSALAVITASGALLLAQAPVDRQPAQTPAAPPVASAKAEKTTPTTLVGCVYREKDIPGRTPNVGERAGLLEDYVFADVASSPIATAAETPAPVDAPGRTPTAVGTSGSSGAMYRIQFVDGDKLKSLVGRRVEVVGRIDFEPGDQATPKPVEPTTTTDRVVGHDRGTLSEIEVSSIKEVPGTCPSTPDPRP